MTVTVTAPPPCSPALDLPASHSVLVPPERHVDVSQPLHLYEGITSRHVP